jgi:hypothetical protein
VIRQVVAVYKRHYEDKDGAKLIIYRLVFACIVSRWSVDMFWTLTLITLVMPIIQTLAKRLKNAGG